MEKEVVNYDFKSQLLEDRKEKIERSNFMKFGEDFHTRGRAEWSCDLYFELDKFIMSLKTGVQKSYLESYIKYSYNGLLFAHIVIKKRETLRVWAKTPYDQLGAVPLFVRDYGPVSRRVGVMITFDDQREFLQNKEAMLDVTFRIVQKAFQGMASRKWKVKTPLLKPVTEIESVKPIEIVRTSSVNILAGENGYLSINLKIHKSQKEILNKILQETILK